MKTNIGVFFGGRSTEHEISVISASQAMNAIDRTLYDITPIYITKGGQWYTGKALMDVSNYRDVPALLRRCTPVYMRPIYGDTALYTNASLMFGIKVKKVTTLDVIIPVLHGANGEDGSFQGILQAIGIPYAGCDVLASANGMDKVTMKMILRACDIPVVDYTWFTDQKWASEPDAVIAQVEKVLSYPVIVKPADLGSSVGIARADNREALAEKITEAAKYSTRLIVEHLVEQLKEINCSVLGTCDDYHMSVLEEPIKTGEILSYTDKYMGGSKGAKGMQASAKRIPAELDEGITKRIQFLAGETFRVLSCHGVARVDLIIDEANGSIYVNEINTIPGSLSFYLWEASGITFSELMSQLVSLALRRARHQSQKIVSYDQNIFALGGGTKGAKGAKGTKS